MPQGAQTNRYAADVVQTAGTQTINTDGQWLALDIPSNLWNTGTPLQTVPVKYSPMSAKESMNIFGSLSKIAQSDTAGDTVTTRKHREFAVAL